MLERTRFIWARLSSTWPLQEKHKNYLCSSHPLSGGSPSKALITPTDTTKKDLEHMVLLASLVFHPHTLQRSQGKFIPAFCSLVEKMSFLMPATAWLPPTKSN